MNDADSYATKLDVFIESEEASVDSTPTRWGVFIGGGLTAADCED